jgi:hypothetical protein
MRDIDARSPRRMRVASDRTASDLAADLPTAFRERARRARAIASRYRGEAARVLIEIADDFDAQAAGLEAPAP